MAACRRGRSPGLRMVAVGAWPVPWAPYGRRGYVDVPLGPVWPPWRRRQSRGPCMDAGSLAGPLTPYGCHGGVAGLLGSVRLPFGRGRFSGPCMAAVGAWPVSCGTLGCRGGVASPVGLVCMPGGPGWSPDRIWPPWRRGRSPGLRMVAVGCGRFFGPRMAAVKAWLVSWALYGRRGGVPVPGPCMTAVGHGRHPVLRKVAVGAWPVPWAQYSCRGGVAGPLGPV